MLANRKADAHVVFSRIAKFCAYNTFILATGTCYVNEVFNTSLPHPRTFEKWYCSIYGQPSFNDHALRVIRTCASSRSSPLICYLMMDKVAIRQQLERDCNKYTVIR